MVVSQVRRAWGIDSLIRSDLVAPHHTSQVREKTENYGMFNIKYKVHKQFVQTFMNYYCQCSVGGANLAYLCVL